MLMKNEEDFHIRKKTLSHLDLHFNPLREVYFQLNKQKYSSDLYTYV